MTTDDLAGILAEHAYRNHPHIGPGGGICTGTFCECGERLTGYTTGDCLPWREMDRLHRAHVATVITAAGWVKGREEARVRMQDPWIDEDGSENDGYMYVTGEHGRNVLAKRRWPVEFRYVTDWAEDEA